MQWPGKGIPVLGSCRPCKGNGQDSYFFAPVRSANIYIHFAKVIYVRRTLHQRTLGLTGLTLVGLRLGGFGDVARTHTANTARPNGTSLVGGCSWFSVERKIELSVPGLFQSSPFKAQENIPGLVRKGTESAEASDTPRQHKGGTSLFEKERLYPQHSWPIQANLAAW